MANQVNTNDPFELSGGSNSGVISLTMVISSGTVQLQKLCGNDPANDTWVDVENGSFSSNGECTFWAPSGQKYRCVFTNATVYRAG